MKITAFFPVILVRDLEAGLKEYEAMGFERKHTTENFAMKSYVLELNGNRVEIFTSQMDMFNMPDGYYGMRINVRDFEEGVNFFGTKGYKLFMGPFENEYARVGTLSDADGRKIFLYKHFRKEEREARANA